MNKEALNVIAQAVSAEYKRAKIYFEDRVETIVLTKKHIEVVGDTISIHFVLDDQNIGKIEKIELYSKDGILMKERPFSYELKGEYNLYIAFRIQVSEQEITKNAYLGGITNG